MNNNIILGGFASNCEVCGPAGGAAILGEVSVTHGEGPTPVLVD